MKPKPKPKPPRVRLDVDERRAQLVALALTLFSQRSYDDISIDELALAAGISKGLLYHYFPTKRDLYVAALRLSAEGLLRETAPDPKNAPDEQVRRSLQTYLDFVEHHGAQYVALIRGGVGSDKEVAAVVEKTRAAITSRILSQLPKHAPSEHMRIALRGWLGFVEAAAIDWLSRRGMSRRALIELLAGTLFDVVARAHRTRDLKLT